MKLRYFTRLYNLLKAANREGSEKASKTKVDQNTERRAKESGDEALSPVPLMAPHPLPVFPLHPHFTPVKLTIISE